MFDFSVHDADSGVNYRPWTDGHAVGYQVVAARGAYQDQRRISDATNLMNDLRRAQARAQKLGFSRRAGRIVQARIEAATTIILVDIFEIDADVMQDLLRERSSR